MDVPKNYPRSRDIEDESNWGLLRKAAPAWSPTRLGPAMARDIEAAWPFPRYDFGRHTDEDRQYLRESQDIRTARPLTDMHLTAERQGGYGEEAKRDRLHLDQLRRDREDEELRLMEGRDSVPERKAKRTVPNRRGVRGGTR